ncbi:GDCCVxC domain-containing (seleno)protein [Roseovarius salis]|uniref:GDCCVxC domain-containing (seleno)protein n=1 Tax=Roseovarius salis TaxID=3376063 RepID=UPI0037C6E00D
MAIERRATITCPRCGHEAEESMPENACQFFYTCRGCGGILRPATGDCCVFCSHANVPCPPVQVAGTCGGATDDAD